MRMINFSATTRNIKTMEQHFQMPKGKECPPTYDSTPSENLFWKQRRLTAFFRLGKMRIPHRQRAHGESRRKMMSRGNRHVRKWWGTRNGLWPPAGCHQCCLQVNALVGGPTSLSTAQADWGLIFLRFFSFSGKSMFPCEPGGSWQTVASKETWKSLLKFKWGYFGFPLELFLAREFIWCTKRGRSFISKFENRQKKIKASLGLWSLSEPVTNVYKLMGTAQILGLSADAVYFVNTRRPSDSGRMGVSKSSLKTPERAFKKIWSQL